MYGLPPQKLPGHGTSGNAYPQQTYAQPIPVSKQVAQRPAAYPSPVQQAKPYPKPYPAQVQQPAKVQYPKPSSPAPASYPSAPVASPAPYPKPSYQSSPSYGNLPAPAPIPAPQSAPIYVAPAVSTAYSAAAAPIPSPDSAPVYIPPAISTVYAAAYEGASGNYPASYPAETLTASSKPTTSSVHSPAPASSSYSTATTSSSYSTAVSSSAYSTSAASPAVQQQDTYKASPEVPTSYSEPSSYPAQKETILDLPTPVYTPLSLKQEATVSETAERQYYPTTTSPAVEVQQSASYPAEASESYSKPETHDEDSKQYNEESKPEQSSSYAAPSAGPRPCDEDAKKDDSSEHSQPSYETHSQDSGSVKAAQEPSNYPETKSYPSSANSVAAPAAPALPVTNAKSNSRPKPTLKPYKATTTSTTTAAPSYPSEATSTTRKPYKAKVPTKASKKPQGPTTTSPKYSETSTYAPASTTAKKVEIKPAYKRPSTSKPVTQVAVSESVGSRYPAEYDNSKVAVDSVPTVKAPSGYSSTAAPVNVATPTRKSSQPTYYSQENSAAKFESYAAPAAVAVSTTQPNYAVSGQSNKPESNGYQTPIKSSPAESNQYSKPDYSQQQGIPSDMIDSYSQQPVSSMESGDYQSQRPVAESNPSVAGQEYDDSDVSETEDQSVTMSMSAIPGEPGTDYPIFSELPDSTFNCSEQNLPGYYADVSARCQVFHICLDDRQWSFLCPNGTIFSQEHFVCVWWNEFDCSQATSLYSLNERLYKENPVSQESPKESYDQSENLASSTTYSKGMDYGSSKSYA